MFTVSEWGNVYSQTPNMNMAFCKGTYFLICYYSIHCVRLLFASATVIKLSFILIGAVKIVTPPCRLIKVWLTPNAEVQGAYFIISKLSVWLVVGHPRKGLVHRCKRVVYNEHPLSVKAWKECFFRELRSLSGVNGLKICLRGVSQWISVSCSYTSGRGGGCFLAPADLHEFLKSQWNASVESWTSSGIFVDVTGRHIDMALVWLHVWISARAQIHSSPASSDWGRSLGPLPPPWLPLHTSSLGLTTL